MNLALSAFLIFAIVTAIFTGLGFLVSETAQLKETNRALEEQLAAIKAENDSAQAHLQDTIRALKEQLAAITAERDSAQVRLQQINTEKGNLQAKIQELQSRPSTQPQLAALPSQAGFHQTPSLIGLALGALALFSAGGYSLRHSLRRGRTPPSPRGRSEITVRMTRDQLSEYIKWRRGKG